MRIRSHERTSHYIDFIPTVLSRYCRQSSLEESESVNQACQIASAWPGQTWYSWYMSDPASYYLIWPMRHRWCACVEPNHNPTSTSLTSVFFAILAEHFDSGFQYRSVNTLRSTISTTHPNIDGLLSYESPPTGLLLTQRHMFNLRPPSPLIGCQSNN